MITNEINSLILDIGSLKSKVGFSGEDKPRIILPSQIGIQY